MTGFPTERRIAVRPEPETEIIADRLRHPAGVLCPNLRGELTWFQVEIERVYYRREEGEGEPRLAFRGKASVGDWSGFKTFFADECLDLVDGATGISVATEREDWLKGLRATPDPLTVGSVTVPPKPKKKVSITAGELFYAVRAFLEHQGIVFGRLVYEADPGGFTSVTMYNIVEHGIPWDGGRYLFFELNGRIRSEKARLGGDPIHLPIHRSVVPGDQGGRQTPFDIIAIPQEDRSITFRPVKGRDGQYVYF